jgi:biopolymer transport protein TolR
MGMSVGGGGGVRGEINVTPLIDVVLVLLIIFMVITPMLQMGYDVNTPPEVESALPPPSSDQIILRMDEQKRIYINKEIIPLAGGLATELASELDRFRERRPQLERQLDLPARFVEIPSLVESQRQQEVDVGVAGIQPDRLAQRRDRFRLATTRGE